MAKVKQFSKKDLQADSEAQLKHAQYHIEQLECQRDQLQEDFNRKLSQLAVMTEQLKKQLSEIRKWEERFDKLLNLVNKQS